MTDKTSTPEVPKLSFLPPEDSGPGMVVYEVDLAPSGTPLAPFKASRFTVEPGCTSPEDSHAVHEIWMVVEGEGELRYDTHTTRLQPGDVVYYEPPKTHQIYNDGDKTMVIYSVWWRGQ